jgi:heme oxygenase
LHQYPDFAALLHGELQRPAYVNLLERLLGLHAAVEDRLRPYQHAPWLAWTAYSEKSSRAARLRRDLAALGVSDARIAAAPSAGALLPPLGTEAAALGCAWVVEGSALGGRVLARGLGTILGANTEAGGSFFLPAPGQPERWRRCCAAVESCGAEPARCAAMVDAAAGIFGVFETWLAAVT